MEIEKPDDVSLRVTDHFIKVAIQARELGLIYDKMIWDEQSNTICFQFKLEMNHGLA
jgi:hypothetical protein